jgi:hypothetical protein
MDSKYAKDLCTNYRIEGLDQKLVSRFSGHSLTWFFQNNHFFCAQYPQKWKELQRFSLWSVKNRSVYRFSIEFWVLFSTVCHFSVLHLVLVLRPQWSSFKVDNKITKKLPCQFSSTSETYCNYYIIYAAEMKDFKRFKPYVLI